MIRCVPAARRSLVTVSAIPDDSQANSLSVLTFVKSRTAMAGGAESAIVWCTGTAEGCAGINGSTGAMKR